MRLFGNGRKASPELVPGNINAELVDLFGLPFLPGVDNIIGIDDDYPEWVTSEEAARRKAAVPPPPPIEELLKNPVVKSIVDAFMSDTTAIEFEN